MLIIKLADVIAIHIVQHGDITAVAVTPPALLPVDEDWVFAGVVLAEPLGSLASAVDGPCIALSADEVGVIAGKRRIR